MGKNLLFIDTETTGLEAKEHGIIEIALVRTTPDASKILWQYSTKIVLEPDRYKVDQRALEINGYSLEKWASACTLEDVMDYVISNVSFNDQLSGHNVNFDINFLKESILRCRRNIPKFYYHTVDTMSLGQLLVAKGYITNVKLVTLTNYFGIKHEAHTALGDCLGSLEVYRKFLEFMP